MILFLVLLAACKPATVRDTGKVESVRVRMVPVNRQEISFPIRSGGIVTTTEEIKLSFKTGGLIARTYVREGDAVKKGQLLAELNLSEIKAQVSQARDAFDKATRDYMRAKNLYVDSVATLEQYQNAGTALNMARSTLDMAKFNLDHSRIFAPKSGIILKQLTRENELVGPGYPVYALGISGKNWIVKTGLSDRDIVKVAIGDSASVQLDAWPNQNFRAAVRQIDEASNPMTGTYEVELALDPTPLKLAYGFIANVEIIPTKKISCFLVPMASVVDADGLKGYVYVVTPGGTAQKIQVAIATLTGTSAAIPSGLEGIGEVVGEGVAYLTDGCPVVIQK
jgi:multidrug efflux system membrane fusion protein